jgi:hypothetical protein
VLNLTGQSRVGSVDNRDSIIHRYRIHGTVERDGLRRVSLAMNGLRAHAHDTAKHVENL